MTTNAQHTPGTWAVETEAEVDEAEVPNVYVCHANTVCDATVVCTIGTHEKDRDELPLAIKLAIARLIAAAPDLLDAALQVLREADELDEAGIPALATLRAAITKATPEDRS